MALAGAPAAATAALSSALSSLCISRRPFRAVPCIASSASPPSQFNISFAPPSKSVNSPTPAPDAGSSGKLGPLYIPWIVRDESGNFQLHTSPPPRVLQALADAKTESEKKKVKNKVTEKKRDPSKASAVASTAPKHSKAARRFYNDNFRNSPQRLSKVLAAAGVASRRSSEELIFGGQVTVNGSKCNSPQTRVDPTRDMIYVNGNCLSKKLPPKVYFALNKPKGYICSSGEKERKSVLCLFDDYMKSWDKRHPGSPKPSLFTVGRLDVATTGLIIVTNDGQFAQKISHPSSKQTKEYIASIDGVVNKRQLIAVSEGAVIDGKHCMPDSVELLPKQSDVSRCRIRIVVHEGRNHEVRELVKNAGLQIYSLKRVRIGGLRLPSDLGIGKYVDLKSSQLRSLGWKS